jgi:hypothetical protein
VQDSRNTGRAEGEGSCARTGADFGRRTNNNPQITIHKSLGGEVEKWLNFGMELGNATLKWYT